MRQISHIDLEENVKSTVGILLLALCSISFGAQATTITEDLGASQLLTNNLSVFEPTWAVGVGAKLTPPPSTSIIAHLEGSGSP